MSSLRPLDVPVALELSLRPAQTFASLADGLEISVSTAYAAAQRLMAAGLVRRSADGLRANIAALEEFIGHGVRYAFPAERGRTLRGVATSHSAPLFREELDGDVDPVVWEDGEGLIIGERVEPLIAAAPAFAVTRPDLYQLLTVVDLLRTGTARDREVARRVLAQQLSAGPV